MRFYSTKLSTQEKLDYGSQNYLTVMDRYEQKRLAFLYRRLWRNMTIAINLHIMIGL